MNKPIICIIIIISLFVLTCQSREEYLQKMNDNKLQPHIDTEPCLHKYFYGKRAMFTIRACSELC